MPDGYAELVIRDVIYTRFSSVSNMLTQRLAFIHLHKEGVLAYKVSRKAQKHIDLCMDQVRGEMVHSREEQ